MLCSLIYEIIFKKIKTQIMKKIIFIAIAMITIAASATAQKVRANENNNLKGERKRIAAGIKDGSITKVEAKQIRKQAKDVKCATRKANADGVVTKREKVNIAKQDRQLDASIAKGKHNNRRRG